MFVGEMAGAEICVECGSLAHHCRTSLTHDKLKPKVNMHVCALIYLRMNSLHKATGKFLAHFKSMEKVVN